MGIFRKHLISGVILICSFSPGLLRAQGQISSPYVPNVILPSPNAAALTKFSDVPVSPYTGTADVTVPIYTIQAKGISVPVSISYHTGGIKLKEEAGWVGLGWALNAGGAISRSIMDHDDFGAIPYFTTMVPQLAGDMTLPYPYPFTGELQLGPFFYDFVCTYKASTSGGIEDFFQPFTSGTDIYDLEPDIYSYNFPGHSGKFIITRAGKVVLQKQENIAIQFQAAGQWFVILDDQGNKFYFTVLETYQQIGAATPTSSWLLSKIVTEQQDSVMFNYTPGGGGLEVQPDISQTYNQFCSNQGLTTSSPAPTYYNNQTLQSIDFANGHLLFLSDGKRSDLEGAYKLDSIIQYSKNAAGALTYQQEHDFFYSYFNSSHLGRSDSLEYCRLRLDSVKQVSGSFSLPPYAFGYNNPNPGGSSAKHSYDVDHWGYYNAAGNSQFIPSITALYNPPGANQQYFTYTGANREPSFPSTQTFSLEQITYPTGGHTVLTYQPNDYDFTNSSTNGSNQFPSVNLHTVDTVFNIYKHGTTSGSLPLSTIFPLQHNINNPTNLTIKVAFMYQVNNQWTYQNTTNKIYFNFTGPGPINVHQDINGSSCLVNTPVCTDSIPLTIFDTGTFTWSGYIDPTIDTATVFSEIHVTFQYQETLQNYNLLENNSFISPASGLRIQSITNYKDASNVASEKTYNYNYLQDKLGTGSPQQYSYGRLMSFPSYVRYTYIPTSGGGYCPSLSLFSSSNCSLTSVIQGNIVGYDQVIESDIDPVTGLDNGKTVYSYANYPDTVISYSGLGLPGTLNMGNNLNGELLSKRTYADNGGVYSKLAETDNYYHTTNRIVYYSPKYAYSYPRSGMIPSICAADTVVEVETIACFYPSIKSERILMDSSFNFYFQQNDSTKYVVSKTYDYYDNPAHYQVTRSRTTDSKGDTMITFLRYPQDYIPSGHTVTGNTILDSMIGRNMVSETIEKQDSFYYPGSSAGYITGAQLSLFRILSGNANTVVRDRTYKLDIQAPVTNFQPFAINNNSTSLDSRYRQMVSFDQYDGADNIQQYTTTDQNPVTIIWDYVHVYPISQVKNAAIADVAATSFESDGTGNWTYTGTSTSDTTSITGSYCYNLGQTNGNITKSGLTSGTTYVVSYWTKNSSAYSITGTIAGYPIKGKTINGWSYYEHKVTGQTTITVSGSGYLDELRLYPATAQMTTFTYSSLAGMTTSCDADNKVTYYLYDSYQRLKRIRDQDGNIIKTFQYHYANQNPANQ